MPALQQLLERLQRHRVIAGAAAGGVIVTIVVAVVVALSIGGSSAGDGSSPTATAPDGAGASATPTATPATGTPAATATTTPTPAGATPSPAPTAVGPGGPGAPPTNTPRPNAPPPAPTATRRPPTATPASLGISVVAPQNGAAVNPTFTLQVAATGIELGLGPGGELIPGRAHWHYAVDSVLYPQGFGTATAQVGPLESGKHTITVTLNLNNSDLTVVALGQVTVLVH